MVNNSYLCKKKNRIEHSGRVESIDGEWVRVRIVQSSACSSCEARKLCQCAESKEKIVKCRSYGVEYHVGDEVMVYGAMSMGRDLRCGPVSYQRVDSHRCDGRVAGNLLSNYTSDERSSQQEV